MVKRYSEKLKIDWLGSTIQDIISSLTKNEMATLITKLFSLPSNDVTKPELDEAASKIHVITDRT